MEQIIIKILAAIFTANYLIEVVGIDLKYKQIFKIKHRVRPLDCHQCLSFWIAVILYFSTINASETLLILFGSGWLIKYFK